VVDDGFRVFANGLVVVDDGLIVVIIVVDSGLIVL
jgi:hypothetical protein